MNRLDGYIYQTSGFHNLIVDVCIACEMEEFDTHPIFEKGEAFRRLTPYIAKAIKGYGEQKAKEFLLNLKTMVLESDKKTIEDACYGCFEMYGIEIKDSVQMSGWVYEIASKIYKEIFQKDL